jgi:HSP20 family protein
MGTTASRFLELIESDKMLATASAGKGVVVMSILRKQKLFGQLTRIEQRVADLYRRMQARRDSPTAWPPAIRPKTDVYQDDHKLVLSIELPGVQQKDIDVSVYGDLLTIRVERKLTWQEQKANLHWSECVKASLARSFYLPEDADGSSIQIEYEKELLRVTIGKKNLVSSRRITVNSGASSLAA